MARSAGGAVSVEGGAFDELAGGSVEDDAGGSEVIAQLQEHVLTGGEGVWSGEVRGARVVLVPDHAGQADAVREEVRDLGPLAELVVVLRGIAVVDPLGAAELQGFEDVGGVAVGLVGVVVGGFEDALVAGVVTVAEVCGWIVPRQVGADWEVVRCVVRREPARADRCGCLISWIIRAKSYTIIEIMENENPRKCHLLR